jgi:hypothetical protein
MTPTTAPLPLPKIPDAVRACAQRDGVADYVNPILEMTRRLFPEAPMAIVFRPDPEVADLHFLSVEVEISDDADGDWRYTAQKRWIEEKLKLGSPDQVFPFTLHLGPLSHE